MISILKNLGNGFFLGELGIENELDERCHKWVILDSNGLLYGSVKLFKHNQYIVRDFADSAKTIYPKIPNYWNQPFF